MLPKFVFRSTDRRQWRHLANSGLDDEHQHTISGFVLSAGKLGRACGRYSWRELLRGHDKAWIAGEQCSVSSTGAKVPRNMGRRIEVLDTASFVRTFKPVATRNVFRFFRLLTESRNIAFSALAKNSWNHRVHLKSSKAQFCRKSKLVCTTRSRYVTGRRCEI